jgi:acetoin utilization deacetylase AcuC-like enzyme
VVLVQVSTLDVGLSDGTQDREYLAAVSEVLPSLLSSFRPDIVLLYDAGVDVHQDDALGRLKV